MARTWQIHDWGTQKPGGNLRNRSGVLRDRGERRQSGVVGGRFRRSRPKTIFGKVGRQTIIKFSRHSILPVIDVRETILFIFSVGKLYFSVTN